MKSRKKPKKNHFLYKRVFKALKIAPKFNDEQTNLSESQLQEEFLSEESDEKSIPIQK